MKTFFILILCYFLGTIPTSVIVSKMASGKDIRELGTNNAGASNVFLSVGAKYGVITAIVDILKGSAATLIGYYAFEHSLSMAYLAGCLAILGHIFPFYLGFKGGKGLACLVGMILSLNFKVAWLFIIGFILLTLLCGYIALGAVGLCIAFSIYTYFVFPDTVAVVSISGVLIVMILKHIVNFKRILKGEEENFRSAIKSKLQH